MSRPIICSAKNSMKAYFLLRSTLDCSSLSLFYFADISLIPATTKLQSPCEFFSKPSQISPTQILFSAKVCWMVPEYVISVICLFPSDHFTLFLVVCHVVGHSLYSLSQLWNFSKNFQS